MELQARKALKLKTAWQPLWFLDHWMLDEWQHLLSAVRVTPLDISFSCICGANTRYFRRGIGTSLAAFVATNIGILSQNTTFS